MSAFFTAASTTYLKNSATPITAVTFTVGMWVRPTTTGVQKSFWNIGDTASANNYWSLQQTAANAFSFVAAAGGTVNTAATDDLVATIAADKWHFVVARAITSTNRRIAAIFSNGVYDHGVATTARVPAGTDLHAFGGLIGSTNTLMFDGYIAEFWMTNADIQDNAAAATSEMLMRQLAKEGPFSVPRVANNLVEYKSLRADLVGGLGCDNAFGAKYGPQQWVDNNGVLLKEHVPLVGQYLWPNQSKRLMLV